MIVHDDNLKAMMDLFRRDIRADLVYMDPPFFSGANYKTRSGEVAFSDTWPSREAYLEALRDRLQLAGCLLEPHGSIVVHVDSKVSHYVKVMCDELWGAECFASEIIWRYRRWPSKQRNFQRVHDVLLRYVADPDVEPRWNQLYEPIAASTRATWGTRKQRAVTDASGKRARSSVTAEESPGVPLGDVWEIGIVAPMAKERTGYPTQKPMALLERLIAATTNPGDLVVDPYMGSGTTLEAALKLGRRAIGIDSSEVAVNVARQRLGVAA